MITSQPKETLVATGARLRTGYLIQQAGYTLGLAAAEGEALEALLEPGYLDEVLAAKARLEAAMQDRELMAQESKQLTKAQDQALREAKLWRRKVVKRGIRMRRLGRDVPDELTLTTRASTVPDVHAQLVVMVASLKKHLEAMGGASAAVLVAEGEAHVAILSDTDALQESTRLAALPQKVVDFFAAKGELLVGLKVINDAGQELHVDDTPRASAYNLRILHRRAGKRSTSQPSAVGVEAPVPA